MLGLAQKATITGTVTDKDMNNEPLPFANVIVKGTKSGTTTDDFGNFTLTVEPGNLNVEFSFLGYETVVVPVVIKAGQTLKLNQVLGSGEGVSLQDVVIATSRRKNTESALVLEMKEAKQVISAISAEQMSKGTDSNAAEAVMRVPGISLVDGRFIIVRGLPERYNNVTINGGIAPSTEVDRRTFAFDLIPTDALDKIIVYKTASADKLGDFAGGLVSLVTSDNTTEFTRASVGFGYRNGTTFNNQIHTEKSSTDWLGYDNGLRSLPGDFPTTAEFDNFSPLSEARMNAGRSLANNWSPREYSTFLNSNVGFSLGRKFNIGKVKVFSTNAIKYAQRFQSYDRFFSEAQDRLNNPITGALPERNSLFNDETHLEKVEINAMSNWSFKFNEYNTIKFKNFFSQIGQNETVLRAGTSVQRDNTLFNNYSFGYISKSIYSGQIEGLHTLNSTNNFDWVLGYNYIRENMPDLRRNRFFNDLADPTRGFTNIAPPSSNLFDNSRFFGNLEEFNATQGLNYTNIIERNNEEEDFAPFKIKAGYLVDYKYRLFKSRYFSYLLPGGVNLARQEQLLALPLNQIFAQENISQTNGWILEEGTRLDSSYKADNFLTAGYVMADLPLGKFDINVGLRAENNIQRIRFFDQTGLYVKEDKNIFNLLPSLNVGYAIGEESQLRLAYSRTVNRPEFREISPFLFYEFEFNVSKVGNKDLESATIDNFDFRYEWYPRKGEVLSLGGFYKSFTNPIENRNLTITEQRAFSVFNAPKAQNYGVEIEAKKSFKDVFNNTFLDRFSVNLNAAYIFSEVDLGTTLELAEDRKRPLQGQSPYIVNFGLEYADDNDFSVYLTYNEFGDRIFSVGNINFATIMEKARGQLDLSVSKKFKNIGVKLSAENIYNNKIQFFEDTSGNYKIDAKNDFLGASFRRGALFSLNLTYNF